MATEGSCLCGTLRFEVEGPPQSMMHCHCSRCRKQHGAPFVTWATYPAQALHWKQGEEAVVSFAAPPGGARHFCGRCGSPAPFVMEAYGVALVPVGSLDGDPGAVPKEHVFVGSKAQWYDIPDSLPQHQHFPPAFGDSPGLPDPPPAQGAADAIHGTCLCGEVAFEARNPVAMFQCHCTRCRKARGAAHGANLFCALGDFHWLRGEAQVVDYKLPEARFYGVAFCGQCGASVPRVSKERGMVVIPASSLDTDPVVRTSAHIFVGSKAPWYEITDSIPQHQEGPPSFSPPPR